MLITYKPEDNPGSPQQWDFNVKRMRGSEQGRIEEQYHAPWSEFYMALMKAENRARRVMLWNLLSREHPKLALRDVPDFYFDELEVELSSQELLDLHDAARNATPEHQRAQFDDVFAQQVAEAREREGLPVEPNTINGEVVPAGKEIRSGKNSPTSTG
jgi:hypothetical protein